MSHPTSSKLSTCSCLFDSRMILAMLFVTSFNKLKIHILISLSITHCNMIWNDLSTDWYTPISKLYFVNILISSSHHLFSNQNQSTFSFSVCLARPPIFQNNDTVQALERILNSHLFDSGPQDSSNHENDVSLTQNITSSSVNATLHRASKPRPDQEPSTLDNDQLFKAAAACLTHANRSNQDTHEYDQIDNDFALGFASEVSGDSSHLSPSPTDQTLVTESRKTLSAEQVEMSIDPRLQGEYSMADEFLHEDDSFEVTSSFLQDPSTPSHLLDLSMSNKNEDVLMRDGCLGNAIDIPTGFSGAQLATTCRSTNSPDPTKGIHSVISPRRLRARTAATKPQNTARAAKRRPGSSISAMLISGDPGARVTIPLKPGTSPDPSCSLATHDPNVDPFLQALEDLESTADKNAGSCYSRKRSRSSSDHISSHLRRHSTSQSVPRGIRPSSTLSSFMLSGVDVHGAGAGGGAAAVLAAAAAAEATGQTSRSITDLLTTYLRTTTLNPMPTDPALEDLSMLAPEPAEQPPESYNPDQFRSFNRIHWTKEEEELLLAEVEMNWQRYDCMAQIMKRHGPHGTVSQTFADRTGVSLKDKAVNVSL